MPPVSYPVGGAPTEPVIADFNNDGVPDVAVAVTRGAGQPGYVAIFLGDGSGGFKAAGTLPIGITGPADIRAADLTGGGTIDLVVTDWYDANVAVLLGNGDGTFAPAVPYATGFDPRYLAIADFNGDGIPDIAVSNQGNGSLNDEGVDIVQGNGDGTFQIAVHFAFGGLSITGLAAGDLNGDGFTDLAYTARSGSVVGVVLSNGDGTFAPAVSYPVGQDPFGLALVDLNGDGNLDIVAANLIGHSLSVFLGNGDGAFAPRTDYTTGNANPSYPVTGDFDGDGNPDIAVLTNNGVAVLLGDGKGGLGTTMNFMASGNANGLAAADLNGDGFTDLVTTGTQHNTMDVLVNDGMWGHTGPGGSGQTHGLVFGSFPAPSTEADPVSLASASAIAIHRASTESDQSASAEQSRGLLMSEGADRFAAIPQARAQPMWDVFGDSWLS